jgi:hypothetical protein
MSISKDRSLRTKAVAHSSEHARRGAAADVAVAQAWQSARPQ